MTGLTVEAAEQFVIEAVVVTREDIARAKEWLLQSKGSNTSGMADAWIKSHEFAEVREVKIEENNCSEVLIGVAKEYSLRLSFLQAAWELINAGVFVSAAETGNWTPSLGYQRHGHRGGLRIQLTCAYPVRLQRLPVILDPVSDPDIFLQGLGTSLHPGILEAIDQSLTCFRRGLYMPATVMLGAAAEATWTECARAVANHLSNVPLQKLVADEPGFAKLVSELHRALEPKSNKLLFEAANCTIHDVTHAEVWTTALRERRNALHWGKAKSFIADHAETGTLLMAAPRHLKTLESLRQAC